MKNKVLSQRNISKRRHVKSIDYYVDLGIYLVLICNFLILLGNSQGITVLVSGPTRLMVSYIFALAIVLFFYNASRHQVCTIDAWFMALAAYAVICFVFQWDISRLVQFMCFAMLPSCAVLYRSVKKVAYIKQTVYTANCCYAVLFILLSMAPNSHDFQGNYAIIALDELTLGFNNTNETGMYLMLSFFIMLSSVWSWKKKWQKNLSIFFCCVQVYMIWQTRCRIVMVLVIMAVAFTLLRRHYRLRGLARRFVLYLPILSLLGSLLFHDWTRLLTLFNEELDSGRYNIYMTFFNSLDISGILIGNAPGSNLHNSYLSIMAAYGIITALLYILFLNAVLREQQYNIKDTKSYVAYIGILCVVTHGIAEGTLLIAGTVYAGLTGLLFLLTLPEEEDT